MVDWVNEEWELTGRDECTWCPPPFVGQTVRFSYCWHSDGGAITLSSGKRFRYEFYEAIDEEDHTALYLRIYSPVDGDDVEYVKHCGWARPVLNESDVRAVVCLHTGMRWAPDD